MKKGIKIIWGLIQVLLIVYIVIVAACVLRRNEYGYTQIGNYHIIPVTYNLKDSSLALEKNNLLIVKNKKDIDKKDSIFYYSLYKKTYIVRATSVKDVRVENNKKNYILNDGLEKKVEEDRILGKHSIHIKHLGGVLGYLETKNGFLIGVLIPVIILFIYYAIAFFMELKNAKKKNKVEKLQKEEKKEETDVINVDTVVDDIIEKEQKQETKEKRNKNEIIQNSLDTLVNDIKGKDAIDQILEEKKEEDDIEVL